MNSPQDKESFPPDQLELFVRQSDENVARFDPQRITDALVRETKLAPEIAHRIATEVQEQIQLSGIQALTAPLIRGLVGAKLLEYGLMAEYRAHSRLGVPVYDVDRIIQALDPDEQSLSLDGQSELATLHGPEGSSLVLAEEIKREYAMLSVFSEAVAAAHLGGDLHIENIGEIDRPTAMIGSIDFIKRHGVRLPGGFAGSRPAKRADVLVLHLVTYTAALQGYFSEALAWDSVNFALAPMLVGLNEREIKQVAQALLFELSSPAIARGGQAVKCDLHLDCDAPAYLRDLPAVGAGGEKLSATYGAMHEVARAFLNTLLEVYLEGDAQGLPFTGPRPILHLTRNFIENQTNRTSLDLAIRAAVDRGGLMLAFDREDGSEPFTVRYGVSAGKLSRANESWQWRAATFSSVAINLPRLGFKAEGNQEKVFELLTELLELAAQASLEKRVFLERLLARGEAGALAMLAMRPDKEPFLSLSWTAHAICPIGLAELTRAVIGTSLDSSSDAQSEAEDFAARVVAHLSAEAERLSAKHKVRFLVAESRDVAAPHRLARFDLQKYGAPLIAFARDYEVSEQAANADQANVFYTNSVKLPAKTSVDIFEKVRIEGRLQAGLIQGATTDLWLKSATPDINQIAALISHAFQQTQVSAISISPEFTICAACQAFSRGIHSNCPQCGSSRVDWLAQDTNRFGRTSSWPRWKIAEMNQRKESEL